ncbi:Zinc metalloproteinase-disintegrin-like VLAIP-B [Trichinella pseudospiralis]
MIGLKEKDRDVTRFLWKDPSRDKLHVYRFNRIPRCLIPSPMEETDSTELHVYGDASKWAYGAVAYLKVISKDKTTTVKLP